MGGNLHDTAARRFHRRRVRSAGWLSDRFGSRALRDGGHAASGAGLPRPDLVASATSTMRLFAILLLLLGVGSGLFAAPNTTAIMNSVPARDSRRLIGHARDVPERSLAVEHRRLLQHRDGWTGCSAAERAVHWTDAVRRPDASCHIMSHLPPTAALFGAFLGYNPIAALTTTRRPSRLPSARSGGLLGKTFFPNLISSPFMIGPACGVPPFGRHVRCRRDRLIAAW